MGDGTMVARYLFAVRVLEPCRERVVLWTWWRMMERTRVVWEDA